MTKVVSEKLGCVMECSNEPCCRSINYKKIFRNEPNCEILHNVVYNTSENALKKNSSFDYVYLTNPEKVRWELYSRSEWYSTIQKWLCFIKNHYKLTILNSFYIQFIPLPTALRAVPGVSPRRGY